MDLAANSTLPANYYYDPAVYAREEARIFQRNWFCIGRGADAPQTGDYIVRRVGGESVILLRGEDGRLRAFFNVCPHRGNRLCRDEKGSIKNRSVICGYHGWTFALDGRLVGTPRMAATDGFDRAAYGMRAMHVHEWEGFVFVNMDEKPAPFAPNLGNIASRLHAYGMGRLKTAARKSYQAKANWKLVVENFTECFHCPSVHPELCAIVPGFRSGIIQQENPGGAVYVEGGNSMTFTARTNRPLISTVEKQDEGCFRSTTIYPNLMLMLVPDHVECFTVWPTGPTESTIVFEWLFEPETMARADFDCSDTVEFADTVNRQDWGICEQVQEGVQSRAYQGGFYSAQEHLPRKFNQWVLEQLG